MSKPSTSDIIARGEYLEPDFNPASLTIPHLLGILGYHGVKYPSQHTKAKLLQLFNDEIKANADQFKNESLSRKNSQASDEGITDGITGQALNAGRRGPQTRGASRRASSQLLEPPAPAPPRPDPVKRRRSTAEPELGPPRRRRVAKPVVNTVAEDSEPEEVEVPVRKVGRNGSSSQAGAEARRVAKARASEDPDSGWEDNNIFQSGAESSSPVRPSPVKPRARRSSAAPRKSTRKSMSVPPQFSPPSPEKEEVRKPRSTRQPSVKPPSSTFEPALPPEAIRSPAKRSSKRKAGESEDVPARPIVEVPSDEEGVSPTKGEKGTAAATDDVAQADRSDAPLDNIREASVEQELADAPTVEPVEDEEALDAQDVAQEDASQEVYDDYEEDKMLTAEVSERIAKGGQVVSRKVKKSPATSKTFTTFLVLLLSAAATSLYNYKTESSPIGFCETGTRSNEVLEGLRTRRAAIEDCNNANRTLLWVNLEADGTQSVPTPTPTPSPGDTKDSQLVESELCPPRPLLPIPPPNDCAPCPANAKCHTKSMTCNNGYLLRPHPLLFFLSLPDVVRTGDSVLRDTYVLPDAQSIGSSGDKSISHWVYSAVSYVFDGLPGFGPVAFPPRCVEDPQRKRRIGLLGKAVESELAAERGRRVCFGVGWKQEPGTDSEEARKWGIEVNTLKSDTKQRTPPHLIDKFEDLWDEAIQQLLEWGGIFMGEDVSGKRYLAHRTPKMDMACTVRVQARQTWDEWRYQVFAFLASISSILYLRHQRAQKAVENDRVAVLAQSALNLLRSQELAHYTDPVTAPHAYLSSLQLRDLILQDEPSIRTRRRLWAGVERVVEENTNIRTNLEEVDGGNEERVWRWIGSAGKSLPQAADESEPIDD